MVVSGDYKQDRPDLTSTPWKPTFCVSDLKPKNAYNRRECSGPRISAQKTMDARMTNNTRYNTGMQTGVRPANSVVDKD